MKVFPFFFPEHHRGLSFINRKGNIVRKDLYLEFIALEHQGTISAVMSLFILRISRCFMLILFASFLLRIWMLIRCSFITHFLFVRVRCRRSPSGRWHWGRRFLHNASNKLKVCYPIPACLSRSMNHRGRHIKEGSFVHLSALDIDVAPAPKHPSCIDQGECQLTDIYASCHARNHLMLLRARFQGELSEFLLIITTRPRGVGQKLRYTYWLEKTYTIFKSDLLQSSCLHLFDSYSTTNDIITPSCTNLIRFR